MKKKLFIIAITVFALAAVSLSFAACKKDKAEAPKKETAQAGQEISEQPEEQKEDTVQTEEKTEDKKKTGKDRKKDKDSSDNKDSKADDTASKKTEPTADKQSQTNQAQAKQTESKKTQTKKTQAKKAQTKKTQAKKTAKKKAKKVWVEPVYETVTVESDTGTTYCHGANSGGGCGASWHGTKEATYQSWKAHWQAYVKRRTAEEAAKGKTYVCDHIHDDCRWVADPPKQEKVLVKKGYWKTVK